MTTDSGEQLDAMERAQRTERRPRPDRSAASEGEHSCTDEAKYEESTAKQGRRKSDLTTFRFRWLDWFSLIDGPTLIDRRIGERLAASYAGLSGTYSHFAKTGLVVVWPGVKTLASELAISERSVQNAMHRLEERWGAIRVRRTKGGSRKTNHYQFVAHNPAELFAGLNEGGTSQRALQGSEMETPQTETDKPRKSGPINPAELFAEESLPTEGRTRRLAGAHAEESRGALRTAAPIRGADAVRAPNEEGLECLLQDDAVIHSCDEARPHLHPDKIKKIEGHISSLHIPTAGRATLSVILLVLYSRPWEVLDNLEQNGGLLEQRVLIDEMVEQLGDKVRPKRRLSLRDAAAELPSYVAKWTARQLEDY